jgi:hypothetical protein
MVTAASANLSGGGSFKINEVAIEVVDPAAMLMRIVAEVRREANARRRRKSPEDAKVDQQDADDTANHAATLLAKLGMLDSAVAREITAIVNALLISAFVVGNKRRRQRMQPVAAHARRKREVKLRPRMEDHIKKYWAAVASIEAGGERATDERVWSALGDSESPYFLWENIGLNTVKRIKKRALQNRPIL